MPTTDFVSEEIRDAEQGNATGFALGTIAYLKQRGLSVEEWPALLGRVFSAWWDQLPQKDLAAIARVAALQPVSLGATVRSLSTDAKHADVVITAWPATASTCHQEEPT